VLSKQKVDDGEDEVVGGQRSARVLRRRRGSCSATVFGVLLLLCVFTLLWLGEERSIAKVPVVSELQMWVRMCRAADDLKEAMGLLQVERSMERYPSWTLFRAPAERVGDAAPSVCGMAASIQNPLGRMGPMLFAMMSVTDDVDAERELTEWAWTRHTGAGRGGAGAAGSSSRPYLAVMGIPSTDQSARAEYRIQQRRSWMRYSEVARDGNDFVGDLLVLYLLSAAEATSSATARQFLSNGLGVTRGSAIGSVLCGTNSGAELLPTNDEEMEAAMLGSRVSHRRVRLHGGWRDALHDTRPLSPLEAALHGAGSPCSHVEDVAVSVAGNTGASATMTVTAPSSFICCASVSVWDEALTYRDVVWIDMLLDRAPTSAKKLGQAGGWGLSAEVGMSKKTMLWLHYAYNAFPDVPYVIKGDDDMFMKVPQMLHDLRFMQAGFRRDYRNTARAEEAEVVPSPPPGGGAVDAAGAAVAQHDAPCIYWGPYRFKVRKVHYASGMFYLLERRLLEVVAELLLVKSGSDLFHLVLTDFDARLKKHYYAAGMSHEDVMIGMILSKQRQRMKETCENSEVRYVLDHTDRFFDVRGGRSNAVTWSAVVVHHCRASEMMFLWNFFEMERRVLFSAVSRSSGDAGNASVPLRYVANGSALLQQWRDDYSTRHKMPDLPHVKWHLDRAAPVTAAERDPVVLYDMDLRKLKEKEDIYQFQ